MAMNNPAGDSPQYKVNSGDQFNPNLVRYTRSSMASASLLALGSSLLLTYVLTISPYFFNFYPSSPEWLLFFAKSLVAPVPYLLGGFTIVRLSSYIDYNNNTLEKISFFGGRVSLILAFLYLMLAPIQLIARLNYTLTPASTPGAVDNFIAFVVYSLASAFFLAAISPTWQNPNQPFFAYWIRRFRPRNRKVTQPGRVPNIAEYYKDISSNE
jgi:hypothetical protein